MRTPNWLRPLAARLNRQPTPRGKPNSQRFRPRFDALEDRTVPAVVQLTPDTVAFSGVSDLTKVGSTLYFQADANDGSGNQLWRTAGQPRDAVHVDIGSREFDAALQAQVGSWLYFFAEQHNITLPPTDPPTPPTTTYTLWRTDSTTGATEEVQLPADVTVPDDDQTGEAPYQLTTVARQDGQGHDLYFGVYSSADSKWELWKVGMADADAGTQLSAVPFTFYAADMDGPYNITAAGSNLYFTADNPNNTSDIVLWASDGTTAAPVQDSNNNYLHGRIDLRNTAAIGNNLYLVSGEGGYLSQGTLWQVGDPGTPAVDIADVGTLPSTEFGLSNNYQLTVVGSSLYLLAAAGTGGAGSVLWKCQGTTASAVWTPPMTTPYDVPFPLQIVGVGSDVYVSDVGEPAYGNEYAHLWKIDDAGNATLLKTFTDDYYFSPVWLTPAGQNLYFLYGGNGYGGGTLNDDLWESGGTPDTTQPIGSTFIPTPYLSSDSFWYNILIGPEYLYREVSPLVAVDSTLYYVPSDGNLYRLNSPPVATADSYAMTAGSPLTVSAADGVLKNDTDPDTCDVGHLIIGPNSLVAGPANGTLTLNSDGSFTYTPDTGYTGSDSFIYRAYDGTDYSDPVTVSLVAVTQTEVQTALQTAFDSPPATGNPTVTLNATTDDQAAAFVALFTPDGNGDTPIVTPTGATQQNPVDIVVTLPQSFTVNEGSLSIPVGIRVQINGGTWIGGSPALTLSSGDLIITGATFLNGTPYATILVTGGHLTLRSCVIEESTGSGQAAIQVTGGTVDLGTAADPGGNTINVNGSGVWVQDTGPDPVSLDGDTFRVNGSAVTSPIVGAIAGGPAAPIQKGTAVSLSASFTGTGAAATDTATWDWGDGTTTAGTVSGSYGVGSVTGNHNYATAGVYTVTLRVTDSAGTSTQSTFQYVVVYDPSAGFVTGGGWINSPAGAYVANPSLTGKATFGFVSQYHNGATVPTGDTQFQFNMANFSFKSTSYDWLVISGAKARYRGTGTVNGVAGYGFELTAWDGDVPGGGGTDRFRIKIWNKATDQVVYDNQMGATDGSDPSIALGGGSIVIHK